VTSSPPTRIGPALAGAALAFAAQLPVYAGSLVVGRIWPVPEDDDGGGGSRYFLLTALTLETVVALICVAGGAYLIVRGRRGLGAGLLTGWALGLVVSCALLMTQGGQSTFAQP
jgi:hypothetical protein